MIPSVCHFAAAPLSSAADELLSPTRSVAGNVFSAAASQARALVFLSSCIRCMYSGLYQAHITSCPTPCFRRDSQLRRERRYACIGDKLVSWLPHIAIFRAHGTKESRSLAIAASLKRKDFAKYSPALRACLPTWVFANSPLQRFRRGAFVVLNNVLFTRRYTHIESWPSTNTTRFIRSAPLLFQMRPKHQRSSLHISNFRVDVAGSGS